MVDVQVRGTGLIAERRKNLGTVLAYRTRDIDENTGPGFNVMTIDHKAVLAVFDERYDEMYAYLSRRVGRDVAEDLASEVFCKAYERWTSFDPAKGTLPGWLYGIASNLVNNHRRAEKRQLRAYARHGVNEPSSNPWSAVDGVVDAPLDRHALTSALACLKPDHRDALLLSVWTDLTYPQIAEALDIPIGTVRSRIARSREQMRELMPVIGEGHSNSTRKDMTWIN